MVCINFESWNLEDTNLCCSLRKNMESQFFPQNSKILLVIFQKMNKWPEFAKPRHEGKIKLKKKKNKKSNFTNH